MTDSPGRKSTSFNSISSAPRRPQKHGSVQSIVKNEDIFKKNPEPFEEITLSDDDEIIEKKLEKCATCSKDMTSWLPSRRDIHQKVCKARIVEKEKERKRSKTMAENLEKNDRVLEKRSPDPKSWELSKNNVRFARIAADDEQNRKRRRPRSFAVVELAPKKCQCEVLTTLHSRFVDEFHCKSMEANRKNEEAVTEHSFHSKRMIEKLSRYEQLSADMQLLLDDPPDPTSPIFTIATSSGDLIKCHAPILKHRTSILKIHPKREKIEVPYSNNVVKMWLAYVYTANIEWTENEKDGVKELAEKYGPVGLKDLLMKEKILEATSEVLEDITDGPENQENPTTTSKVLEDAPIQETPEVDYFETDDPFLGFGKVPQDQNSDEQRLQEIVMLEEENPIPEVYSPPQMETSKRNVTMDSFDEWSNQPSTTSNSNLLRSPSPSPIVNPITPIRNVTKPIFGSHIKILKTNDITPMPEFDRMDETELKEKMKEIGMRPKGKKAMIQILKKAYATLHPEICTGTPTIRPLVRAESSGILEKSKVANLRKKTLSERFIAPPLPPPPTTTNPTSSESQDDADKTLNTSNDDLEAEAGRICGDDVGGEDDDEDEVTTGAKNGKPDLDALRIAFLTWLRDSSNTLLHEHILSLQPVSLEEMLIRLEKADGPLGRIGKAKLVKLLDALKITYQLPQKPGRARAGFKRKL